FDSLAHRVVLGQEQRVLRGIEAGDEIHPDREILVAEGIGTLKHDTFHGAQSQLSRHTRPLYARVEGREYGERVATSAAPSEEVPAAIALGANLPNPFRTATRIPFEVRHARHVQVVIYDLTGRAVAVLVDGHVSPGRHEAVWAPDGLASGVYVGALITDAALQTRLLPY